MYYKYLTNVGSANGNIVVDGIYRHPRPKETLFLKYFKNILNKIEKKQQQNNSCW